MNTLCKTPLGTVGGFWWNNGIAFGKLYEGNFCSLEYNPKRNKLELRLCGPEMERQNVELVYCDAKFNPIEGGK